MNKQILKKARKQRRQVRIRATISGTTGKPRLNVFKSNQGMFLQIINDECGCTLVSAHSNEVKEKMPKTDVSFELGKIIAKKAIAKNITTVVFDRGGNVYHGRVKAAADGAREGGLQF